MEQNIAAYEIADEVKEITLDEAKIFNIAKIFQTIIGEGPNSLSHSVIRAEVLDYSILKEYYEDREEFEIKNFALRLLEAEKSKLNDVRKKSIREGFLFVKESISDLTLLKLEQTSVADKDTFELKGELGTEKNYYKACIFKNELDNIAVIDKNQRIANYWLRDFLGLQEVRNSKLNTNELIELIISRELFSDTIKGQDKFNEIVTETENYIFENPTFNKSNLIDYLNSKELTDIPMHEANYENHFFAEQALRLDSNFVIDQKTIREKYKKNIQVSRDTFIRTDNIVKLKRRGMIRYDNGEIILIVSDEFIQNIEELLGDGHG